MFNIGIPELVLILIIALIVFGPGKLPKVGKALGDGLSEFKKAASGLTSDVSEATSDDESSDEAKKAADEEPKA